MNKFKLILVYIVVIILVVGAAVWLNKASKSGPKDMPGQSFENQGQIHIDPGSLDHPPYNSNPPTSGWHWPQPAAWGTYDTALPDEQLVHNLEHGGVWISYRPDKVDQKTIDQLKDFSRRYPLVIVTPRAANDSSISLAAWTHLQNLDQYDETTILKFIDAYYNQGPEKVM